MFKEKVLPINTESLLSPTNAKLEILCPGLAAENFEVFRAKKCGRDILLVKVKRSGSNDETHEFYLNEDFDVTSVTSNIKNGILTVEVKYNLGETVPIQTQ